MSDADKKQAKTYTDFYKNIQEMTFNGDYYRLVSPFVRDSDVVAWQIVSKDRSQSLVTVVATDVVGNPPFVYIKLRGLKSNVKYKVKNYIYSGDA
ncbi:GH36 C-terminal domain-containing protein [Companilactobacillus kimchii]